MVMGGGGDATVKVGGWDVGCLLRRKVLIMCLLIICLFVECLFANDMFVLNVPSVLSQFTFSDLCKRLQA